MKFLQHLHFTILSFAYFVTFNFAILQKFCILSRFQFNVKSPRLKRIFKSYTFQKPSCGKWFQKLLSSCRSTFTSSKLTSLVTFFRTCNVCLFFLDFYLMHYLLFASCYVHDTYFSHHLNLRK